MVRAERDYLAVRYSADGIWVAGERLHQVIELGDQDGPALQEYQVPQAAARYPLLTGNLFSPRRSPCSQSG